MNIPTIAKPNITSSYLTAVSQPQETGIRGIKADAAEDVSITYHLSSLDISSTLADDLQIKVVNLAGQTFMNTPIQLSGGCAKISVSQLPAGVYIANVTDKHGQKAACKFVIITKLSR